MLSCPIIILNDTDSFLTDKQEEKEKTRKMTSYWTYRIPFFTVPLTVSFMIAVAVGLVGHCILKRDKLVRIVFPYIRKRGNDNVMFGYIISKRVMTYGLFLTTLTIVFQTVLVFLSNILIGYPLNDKPYAKSMELDCYYLMNYSLVEEYSKAVLTILELEEVWCFAINFNIAAASGQATGALALSWLIVSVETWILLNVNNKIKNPLLQRSERSYWCWFVPIVTIGSAGVITATLIAYFFYHEQWVYFLFQPENGLFTLILWASLLIMDTDNVREPEIFERQHEHQMEEEGQREHQMEEEGQREHQMEEEGQREHQMEEEV